MLLSRSLARRRIASGTRPGWAAAWVPVLADGALAGLLIVLVWPLVIGVTAVQGWPVGATMALMFVVFFLPLQAVLILSSLWATKSRWQDKDQP